MKNLPKSLSNIIKNMSNLEKFLKFVEKKLGHIFNISTQKQIEDDIKNAYDRISKNFVIGTISMGMGHYAALSCNLYKEGFSIAHLGGSNGYDYCQNKLDFDNNISEIYSIDTVYEKFKKSHPEFVDLFVYPESYNNIK